MSKSYLFLRDKIELMYEDILIIRVHCRGVLSVNICRPDLPPQNSPLLPRLYFTFYWCWLAWNYVYIYEFCVNIKIFTRPICSKTFPKSSTISTLGSADTSVVKRGSRKMNVNFENSMWSEIYYCGPIFS